MSELILYIDGKPISVVNDMELISYKTDNYVSCTTGTDQTFTVNGLFEPEEWTFEQQWNYNWYASMWLPRKQKKGYRKKLLSMLCS